MSYLSLNLSNLIAAVKKASSSLDRDFSEIEQLQSSVKDYRTFVMNGYNKVERVLKQELSRLRPNYAFAADGKPLPQGGYFVISPIGGLSNFIHGIAKFSVSVAMCENSTTIAAVVYNPASDELFFAEKGMGAYKEGFRNHERLRVSARKEPTDALVAFASSSSAADLMLQSQHKLNGHVSGLRLNGDSSLDLAYVASGKLDSFIGYGLGYSELVAGMLLVKEAGGYIYEPAQKDIRTENLDSVIASGDIFAVNANLNNKLYDLLNK